MKTYETLAHSVEEMRSLGMRLAPYAYPGLFLALYGDLGAGKTVFVRGLAQGMGVHDILSPTFTIVREHKGLLHFDAYRLSDAEELYAIGFSDYLARDGVIAMEWPENVAEALPEQRLEIHLEGSGSMARRVSFSALGERAEQLLEEAFG